MGEGTILDKILATKRREVARQKQLVPQRYLEARIREAPAPRPFRQQLRGEKVAVIAEVKRASPSKGILAPHFDPEAVARRYEAGGAAAISVLTDEPYFGGELAFLPRVKEVTSKPVLRKDFIIDPYQVWEARAWRADALLLIVSALEPPQLRSLLELTWELNMEALVEVHTEPELEVALEAGARVVGINNRNLATFDTGLEVTEALAPLVPGSVVLVSESGIGSATDVARVARAGADAVLVGESLMRHPDAEQLLKALASVPREPVRREAVETG